MIYIVRLFIIVLIAMLMHGCSQGDRASVSQPPSQGLKEIFQEDFLIGAAISKMHIEESDAEAASVIEAEFSSLTPENEMKWMYIHPGVDSFYFDVSDQYLALAEKLDMHVVGHALVWHSQLAEWVEEVKDSAEMARHFEHHINTIVSRYKGRIDSWDVVNEALNEDGSLRESHFYELMGENYLEHAFKLAAAADPSAELVYNDYNMWKPEKRAGAIRMVKRLQESGAKIDAIGMQAHWSLVGPEIEDIEASILAYAALGVKVMFTELDVTALPNPWDLEGAEVSQNFEGSPYMNPYPESLPDSMQLKLAERYEDIFRLFLKHSDKISRVTFWGVNDGHSWLNNWPIKNRVNYPLLFDRAFQRKKAYDAVTKLKRK